MARTIADFHFKATGAQPKKAYRERLDKEAEQIDRLVARCKTQGSMNG